MNALSSATSLPFFANTIASVAFHRRMKYALLCPLRWCAISLSFFKSVLHCEVDAPDVSNPTGKNCEFL